MRPITDLLSSNKDKSSETGSKQHLWNSVACLEHFHQTHIHKQSPKDYQTADSNV